MINQSMKFSFRENETSEYVHHPINAFHLLKRSSKFIPKLKKWLPKKLYSFYDIKTLSEQYIRACQGLADIQEFHDTDPMDIANGIIKNTENGLNYQANSKLNSMDLVNIAKEAKDIFYYDANVKWLTAALKISKRGKENSKFIYGVRYT